MKITVILFMVLLVFGSTALASKGSINGAVRDAVTGEPLLGATVTVLSPGLGTITGGAVAGSDGRFTISGIESGSYNVRFSMLSYKTILKNRVVVKGGAVTGIDVSLEVSPLVLGETVVRPSFFERSKDAAASSQRMDFEEIIAQPGGSWDVQRAVQAMPAVVSAADNDNEIIVRGANYGENLFVLDDIEIANPNHFGDYGTGGGGITMINTDFVRQVDFIAGAFPARYGDKASSVMDIAYREGSRDRMRFKVDLGAAGCGATAEGPLGSGTFMVSGHKSFLSLIAPSVGMTSVPYYYDVQGKTVCHPAPNLMLSLTGIYGNDRQDIEPGENDLIPADQFFSFRAQQYAAGLTAIRSFRGGFARVTASRTKNFLLQRATDTTSVRVELFHHRTSEFVDALKFDLSLSPSRGSEWSAGISLKHPSYWHDIASRPDTLYRYYYGAGGGLDSAIFLQDLGTVSTAQHGHSWKIGAFVQCTRDIGAVLTATAGLRWDRFAYTGAGSLSPRLGLSYHVSQSTDVNLSVGRHFQSPDWSQLTGDPANALLRDKRVDQAVLGIDRRFSDDTKLSVEAYFKRYRDVPIPVSDTTSDPNDQSQRYLSLGRGEARGVELFLQKKVKRSLWGTASYSYSIARAVDPRNPSRRYNWDFDYRHVLTLIAGYRIDLRHRAWFTSFSRSIWYKALCWLPVVPAHESELSVRYRYLGGRPYTPMAYHAEWRRWTLDPDADINSARLSPYQRLDLHIQKRWYLGRLNVLTYLEVENLSGRKNVWGYLYNKDGRIKDVYQFDRMVYGGVVFEF